MKKIMIICLALMITVGASAQKYRTRSHYRQPVVRSYVTVGVGGYNPYGPRVGYPRTTMYPRTSHLQNEIAGIKADYKDKIWSAKHDKSLSKAERKREVHDLKYERDKAIRDLENNYHRR